MADGWRKLLPSAVICLAVTYGILLLAAVFEFSLERVLQEFHWEWISARAWAELVRLAPASLAWATLLTWSWVVPITANVTARAGKQLIGFARFRPSITAILALSLAWTVVYLVEHPRAVARVEAIELSSAYARGLLASAGEARERRDYRRAVDYLERYLRTLPGSEAVTEQLAADRGRLEQEEIRLPVRDAAPAAPPAGSREALLDRAQAAAAQRDYSTAHYMASLARVIAPADPEAARIATEALERLGERAARPDEQEDERFFSALQEAKAAVTRGEHINAYYLLVALRSERPLDVDVARYLAIAEGELANLASFREEIEDALSRPGGMDVAFVNRSDETVREFVYLGKVVLAPSGLYARDIEVLRQGAGGEVLLHLESDYARFAEGHLLLRVIGRQPGSPRSEPRIRAGSDGLDPPALFEMSPSSEQLWLLASVARDPQAATLADLSRAMGTLGSFGLLPESARLEFLSRIAAPLICMSVSLFALGFAWRYRSRYLHRPPVLELLLVPASVLLVLPAFELAGYAQRLVNAALLLSFGMPVALVLLAVVQALVLSLCLVYVALIREAP